MKTLYHEVYLSYTSEADSFSEEIENAIKPIIKKYFKMGYSPRELGAITHDTIGVCVAEMILIHAYNESRKKMKQLKAEKNPNKVLPGEGEENV